MYAFSCKCDALQSVAVCQWSMTSVIAANQETITELLGFFNRVTPSSSPAAKSRRASVPPDAGAPGATSQADLVQKVS